MPFQRAFEGIVESAEPLLESGATINIYWSPQSIFPPVVDDISFTVDITLRVLDIDSGEWKTLAMLASDLPNSGEAQVTIPNIPELEGFDNSLSPVVVEVGISTTSMTTTRKRGLFSNILQKVGRFGLRILKQTPMRLIKRAIRQVAQRLACEAWAELIEDEDIGEQINNRLPPCPCTAERARAPNSGFNEEKLSSIVKVIGRIQDYIGTTIADDAFREYFHPGSASCYRQRVDIP